MHVAMLAAIVFLLLTLHCTTDAMVLNGTEMTIDQAIMAASKSPKILQLTKNVNVVRVELDMLFKTDTWKSMMRERVKLTRRHRRKAVRVQDFRWVNAVVPYYLMTSWSDREHEQFQLALNEYHDYTCVRFRQATASDADYLRVVDGDHCASHVGRQCGPQEVSLPSECRNKGIIVHELGHALGFIHEHNRPDRDDFVKIVEENVLETGLQNFAKSTEAAADTFGVPYDYLSVMHYGSYYNSHNGQRTILTKDPAFQKLIGQRGGLSFRDIKRVNKMYGCAAKSNCPEKQCPGEGFVGLDCACWCPSVNDTQPVTRCSVAGTNYELPGPQPSLTLMQTVAGQSQPSTAWPKQTTQPPSVSTRPAKVIKATTKRGRPCRDAKAMCSGWARRGGCHANPGYMLVHCAASCSSCEGATATVAAPAAARCLDADAHCDYWRGLGYCLSKLYVAYMQQHCPKACGVCSIATASASAARTTPRAVSTT